MAIRRFHWGWFNLTGRVRSKRFELGPRPIGAPLPPSPTSTFCAFRTTSLLRLRKLNDVYNYSFPGSFLLKAPCQLLAAGRTAECSAPKVIMGFFTGFVSLFAPKLWDMIITLLPVGWRICPHNIYPLHHNTSSPYHAARTASFNSRTSRPGQMARFLRGRICPPL